jgi:hypothetical protein
VKLMKYALLTGAAALTAIGGSPADATWSSSSHGSGKGGSSSGWGSSGWGSSGWGGSSSYGGTSGGSTGGTSGGSSSGSSGGSSSGGTPVPEPSNVMMLGLGLAGLFAGRFVAGRRRKKT